LVLCLGLNDVSVHGLIQATRSEWFAWDAYRRVIRAYRTAVVGIPNDRFERLMEQTRAAAGAEGDGELDARILRDLVIAFRNLVPFPQDVDEQLWGAIRAAFDSLQSEPAGAPRLSRRIPSDWGAAIAVRQIAYGKNVGRSGSGVAFKRDQMSTKCC
jgi:pyruvate, orthophosphate dikinase